MNQQPTNFQQSTSNNNTLTVVLIVCIAVAIALLVGFMVLYFTGVGPTGNSPSKEENTEDTAVETTGEVQNVDISRYFGYWHSSQYGYVRELTIHGCSGTTVEFSIWYHMGGEINKASARIGNGNTAFFEKADTGEKIAGKLIFEPSHIELIVTESDVGYMKTETIKFDGRHAQSEQERDKQTATTATTAPPKPVTVTQYVPAPDPVVPSGYAVVNTGYSDKRLHLRTGPGQGYGTIEMMYTGTRVQILSYSGSWARVYVPASGSTGWCHSAYLSR